VSIRFIYFDLGSVLVTFSYERGCRQMAAVSGVRPERVYEVVFAGDALRRMDLGQLSRHQFYEEFCRETESRPDFDELERAGSAIFELNFGMLPIITQLSLAGYRMGILSNTCESHWNYISSGHFGLFPDDFEQFVLSYEVGAMKPDEKIFRVAAEKAGVAPSEIFFMDDREENVAGAVAAGFQAVHYQCPAQIGRALRRHGVPLAY